MTKLIALLKRRPDIDQAHFIRHYETSHVPIIMRHFGSFIVEYERTYLNYGHHLSYVGNYESGGKSENPPFDVVTTLTFAKPSDLDQMFVVAARSEVAAEIAADEEHFLDRSANQIIISDESHATQGASEPR